MRGGVNFAPSVTSRNVRELVGLRTGQSMRGFKLSALRQHRRFFRNGGVFAQIVLDPEMQDSLKRAVENTAVEMVKPGNVVGLEAGSGPKISGSTFSRGAAAITEDSPIDFGVFLRANCRRNFSKFLGYWYFFLWGRTFLYQEYIWEPSQEI